MEEFRIDLVKWGFDGYFVSDCWAIRDFHENHKITEGPVGSVTKALKAGCDLNCGCTYEHVMHAFELGQISEEERFVVPGPQKSSPVLLPSPM